MRAILLLWLAFQPQDESLEKARKLIEECAAKLKAAPAVSLQCDTFQGHGGVPSVPTRSRILIQGPDRLRWEWTAQGYDVVQLYDGERMWHFDKLKGEYSIYPQNRGSLRMRGGENPVILLCFEKNPMKILEKGKDVVVTRRKEGDETYDVISWRAKDPWNRADLTNHTLWLSPSRLPKRLSKSWEFQDRLDTRDVEIIQIDLAPKVPEDAFAFKPPEGAKEKPAYQGTGMEVPDTEEARKAKALFIEVHKAFRSTDALSYDYETRRNTDEETGDPPVRCSTTLKRPEFIRQSYGSAYGRSTTLCDGESTWSLSEPGKNFTRSDLYTAAHRLYTRVDPLMHLFFEGAKPEIFYGGVLDIEVGKDDFEGETMDLVGWSFAQGETRVRYRMWIGADRRPRQWTQESTYQGKTYLSATAYQNFDLKPSIPKDHFTFTPDAGWTDRSDEPFGGKLIPAGKAAPDFQAVTAAGETIRLSSYLGSTVVLIFGHFTHSWDNARAQEFHDEFSKRGLKVVAVSVLRDGPAPNPKKYTFSFLRVKEESAAKSFGVDYHSGGIYLLGADMKVIKSTYSNDDLRAAVKELPAPEKDGK